MNYNINIIYYPALNKSLIKRTHMITDYIDNIPQPDNSGSEQVTLFDDQIEDKLRKFLYTLFDLSYNEIQVLKGIMNHKSLTEIAYDIQKNSAKNTKVSRHKIFQQRKAILIKLGNEFSAALLTDGQRKVIKGK